jgi:hypothetical protein
MSSRCRRKPRREDDQMKSELSIGLLAMNKHHG